MNLLARGIGNHEKAITFSAVASYDDVGIRIEPSSETRVWGRSIRPSKSKPAFNDYEKRLKELAEYAKEEDHPGINSESKNDFEKFINSFQTEKRFNLFLLDNGNLSISLELDNQGENTIELDFLGTEIVKYLLVREGAPAPETFHSSGTDTMEWTKELVSKFHTSDF